MAFAGISLGSNLGDRLANLRSAVRQVELLGTVARISRVYQTAPMYVENQPAFLNAAVLIETQLGPLPLLRSLKSIEKEIGRQNGPRFGPREIDLDLISYGVLRYRFTMEDKDVLVLPHPRAGERRFVLRPLFDLDPNFDLPGLGKVKDLLNSTESQASSVHELSDALLPVLRN